MNLIEELCAVSVVAILAVLTLTAVVGAAHHAIARVRGIEYFANNRIDVFVSGTDAEQMEWSTNKPLLLYETTRFNYSGGQ